MSMPLQQKLAVAKYIAGKKIRGEKKYPLVLELEPLLQCNLACAGCGKIQHPDDILRRRLSVEECIAAVEECGAPMVSIAGGEPLVHDQMPQIVEELVKRKKFVFLCTNALLLKKKIANFKPSIVLCVDDSPRRNARSPRRVGLPGRRLRQSRRGDQRSEGARLSRVHEHDVLRSGRRLIRCVTSSTT